MSHDGVRLDGWVRMASEAFEVAFDEALADRSTTRAELLMLTRLAAAPEPLAWDALESGMGPAYGPVACTDAWNALEVAGWAVEPDGLYAVTDAGRALVEELTEARDAIIARATDGLSEDEVATAVIALRGILANLEA
ncbi:MarR family winged helix-turn-helix transcriptional regulator [Demequina mangrovi]|uniref:DNA-binding transcriptional regulator, MarR family n=1 Tax=Demequina mangrovi TaxID=1043493 RepID=A0A1H6ZKL2_9MICO|nr:MarR family winged helix-turn-helix transcriptional regulator [Demequina mangrovi]SEJ52674.1 hypothetical protein SAMN05421637_2150 [Demequina mangrovi]